MMTQKRKIKENLNFTNKTDSEVVAFTLNSNEDNADKIAAFFILSVSDEANGATLSENRYWSIVVNGEESRSRCIRCS